MKLQHIKEENCPECGAEVSEERRNSPHTNGYWNEYRVFHCGKELHFSPNFIRVVDNRECQRTPKFLERSKREKRFKRKVELVIENGKGVSTEFRERLLRAIDHV